MGMDMVSNNMLSGTKGLKLFQPPPPQNKSPKLLYHLPGGGLRTEPRFHLFLCQIQTLPSKSCSNRDSSDWAMFSNILLFNFAEAIQSVASFSY